jgi:DNA-binding IclR family transcriptional regulator
MPTAAPETETPYRSDISHLLPKLQMTLLLILKQRSGVLSLSQLATETGTHTSTAGGSLTALRADGLVKKLTEGPRAGQYAITAAGEEVLRLHFAFHAATDPYRRK